MNETASENVLIWIGAGNAENPSINFGDYDRVLLIDARSESCNILSKRFVDTKVIVKNVAVVGCKDIGEKEFSICNIGDFSALSEIKGLTSLFPSATVVDKCAVQKITIISLIDELNLSKRATTLVLDVPDQAYGILAELVSKDYIGILKEIIILYSGYEIYKDMIPIDVLRNFFYNNNFYLKDVDKNDPDLFYLKFVLSYNTLKINELESKLNEAEIENTKFRHLLVEEYERKASLDVDFFELKEIKSNELFSEISLLVEAYSLAKEIFKSASHLEILEEVSSTLTLRDFEPSFKFFFCLKVSQLFSEQNEPFMAVHFINTASRYVSGESEEMKYFELATSLLKLDNADLAIDYSILALSELFRKRDNNYEKFLDAYKNIRKVSIKIQQHGHDLLIDYINEFEDSSAHKLINKVFVEIGTTREEIPGQGSTFQLAKLCHSLSIEFITVDMDPNNTGLAGITMASEALSGRAVNQKGEDFLAEYEGQLDYVFLDAYDFDHGHHSELRQSRYEKYLGHRIDENECHLMHLKCATALVDKLTDKGVVCIDDTWRDEKGDWTAKGTLAVPFLLENGFEIIDERNRAVLMRRNA